MSKTYTGPPSNWWGTLLSGFTPNVQNRYYKDETVHLDGYTFTNCCFNNCTLVTETGAFSIKNCLILPNCKIHFGPAATRVIQLWNVSNQNIQWPFFNPQIHPDGSITIG